MDLKLADRGLVDRGMADTGTQKHTNTHTHRDGVIVYESINRMKLTMQCIVNLVNRFIWTYSLNTLFGDYSSFYIHGTDNLYTQSLNIVCFQSTTDIFYGCVLY